MIWYNIHSLHKPVCDYSQPACHSQQDIAKNHKYYICQIYTIKRSEDGFEPYRVMNADFSFHLPFLFVSSKAFKYLLSNALFYHTLADRGQYSNHLRCRTNSKTFSAGKHWMKARIIKQMLWDLTLKMWQLIPFAFSDVQYSTVCGFRHTAKLLKVSAVFPLLLQIQSNCRFFFSFNVLIFSQVTQ